MMASKRLIHVLAASVFLWFLNGCTANAPFRTGVPASCPSEDCASALIERHEAYDLAFVEFTERGNVFRRRDLSTVIGYVAERAEYDEQHPDRGVLAIVFVHGWKHNASAEDANVKSFKKLLAKAAKLTANDGRRLVGIYVGWRGLSLKVDYLKELSYWDRKAVAHQVGKGGVTELLLRLEHAVIDNDRANRNLLLITGHSFGGAIVLSALNEILLERVLDASSVGSEACFSGRHFGHGVALLNPAIEANEALQLKEIMSERCFRESQDRLMHVISSDADEATNKYFLIGQWLGVNLSWRQADLEREFGGKNVRLSESDLDTITIGNYAPFRTGRLEYAMKGDGENEDGEWRYATCVAAEDCVSDEEKANHIPVASHEPLAFIQTDGAFIRDHNDVFNDGVAAYLAAIVAEARNKRVKADKNATLGRGLPSTCDGSADQPFDFGPCFQTYQGLVERIDVPIDP